jgi:putative phosphoesterase
VDINAAAGEQAVTGLLAREAARRKLDILLVAGDISSDYALSLKTIDSLAAESGVRVLFVPGNHDIWNERHPSLRARDTYDALLSHPANLARGPIFLNNNWAIVGDLGWYDFAYGDPSFSRADFERMRFGERTWQDKIKSLWDLSTIDVHRMFLKRLEETLDLVEGHRILLATHVVQIRDFTVLEPGEMWKYFNAFLGSPDYGELCIRKNVDLAVCGHVHYRRRARRENTEFVCPCLGYAVEWPSPRDTAREIAETLAVYELENSGAIAVY